MRSQGVHGVARQSVALRDDHQRLADRVDLVDARVRVPVAQIYHNVLTQGIRHEVDAQGLDALEEDHAGRRVVAARREVPTPRPGFFIEVIAQRPPAVEFQEARAAL